MIVAAKGRAAEAEAHQRAWLAWTTANLTRFAYHDPKHFPTLDSLTAKRKPAPVQTPDQMRAVFAAMRASADRRAAR